MSTDPHSERIDAILTALDIALYERGATGELAAVSSPPAWLAASGAKDIGAPRAKRDELLHPFLAHFLHDAERWWAAGGSGRLKSDVWLETRSDGTSDGFQATALRVPNQRAILVVELVRDFAAERQAPLQAARDSRLHFERLQKEIDKKEMLLHCIVHDLKGPLAGMLGVLSLMKQHELAADRVRELTELGVSQARKQESMIQGILEVFASEISSLESFERDPARAPDLVRAAKNVADMLRPVFARKQVELVLDLAHATDASHGAGTVRGTDASRTTPGDAAHAPVLVAGHAQRLERVLTNLVENALRHSPRQAAVELRVATRGALAHVAVEDRGLGVPDAIRAQLFEKFVQDPALGGTTGLGLYFCRMNVERWGGRIGCEPREGGGSRFWFDLPRAVSA